MQPFENIFLSSQSVVLLSIISSDFRIATEWHEIRKINPKLLLSNKWAISQDHLRTDRTPGVCTAQSHRKLLHTPLHYECWPLHFSFVSGAQNVRSEALTPHRHCGLGCFQNNSQITKYIVLGPPEKENLGAVIVIKDSYLPRDSIWLATPRGPERELGTLEDKAVTWQLTWFRST